MREIGLLNGYVCNRFDNYRTYYYHLKIYLSKVMVVRDLPVIWNIIFRPFLKIDLTFANLEALGNLFKNIERLQISATGLERK